MREGSRMVSGSYMMNPVNLMKLEIIKDCESNFEHPFYWKIGNHYLQMAKDLWKNV